MVIIKLFPNPDSRPPEKEASDTRSAWGQCEVTWRQKKSVCEPISVTVLTYPWARVGVRVCGVGEGCSVLIGSNYSIES